MTSKWKIGTFPDRKKIKNKKFGPILEGDEIIVIDHLTTLSFSKLE